MTPEEGRGAALAKEGLPELIAGLRAIAAALPEVSPEVDDGAVWVRFETAMSDLYSALVALEDVERDRGQGLEGTFAAGGVYTPVRRIRTMRPVRFDGRRRAALDRPGGQRPGPDFPEGVPGSWPL